MSKKLFPILLTLVHLVFSTIAQELPPITLYTPDHYGAENQNWDVTQSPEKFIYIANNQGVLEFNGEDWQLYPTPNETIMRSVKWYKEKLYSGFYMDFGFWERNEFGLLTFTSIVQKNEIKMKEDEQIWEIEELDGWLIFKSLSRIYLYNTVNEEIKIIDASHNITKLAKVGNVIYFHELNKGIFKIENGIANLVSDASVFLDNKIVDIFDREGKIFIITQKQGIFVVNEGKVAKWEIEANRVLNSKTIYSSLVLENNHIILGTIASGIVYLDEKGSIRSEINQSNGLGNNTVLKVFEDIDKNIWLGLDNGINIINVNSPFKIFTQKSTFWGTIYSAILHNGQLYIGTNQGVYVKTANRGDEFEFIENTEGQVWNLQVIDNELFCSHDSGTFIIKGENAKQISNIEGTWGVQPISENIILQGNYDGLYVLEKDNKQWRLRNKIEGFSNSSKYFEFYNDEIFVNHEYKGVFRLKVDDEFRNITKVVKDSSVSKGIHSSLIKYKDQIIYASKKGVFTFNKKKGLFNRDSILSKLIPISDFLSAKLIYDQQTQKLWSFTNKDLRYVTAGKLTSEPELHIIPITGAIHQGATGYENIIALSNDEYFVGTSTGYITLNISAIESPNDYQILITNIFKNKIDKNRIYVNLTDKTEFSNTENNLAFYFTVPNYNKASSLQYQFKLEGLNEKWNDFTTQNNVVYENLPPGSYIFKVRSLLDNKFSTNIESYDFTIAQPFYFSRMAIIGYIIFFILIIYTLHVISRRYYSKEKERVLESTQRELELKALENQQEIIKLNNEKLRDDINSKNRELATSTMSIIKKNEFLNTIKNELISGGKDKVDKVIRIIDKNLNNTDDWKLFQEAFNNVDKEFLKRIKVKHPELTPNDLRLCAYLRLNLSSKEIAPLLNISPRSVEVKRYRLRKKMNLAHNDNLTNYILEM